MLVSSQHRHIWYLKWVIAGLLKLCFLQCGRSRMFIPDPGSWFLPIPDPGSKKQQQKRGVKKIWCHSFLCSHKFHKIVHYFSFEVLKKKIWANFQRILELFTHKIVTKLSKVWVWDPGFRGQKGTGSATPCFLTWLKLPGFTQNDKKVCKNYTDQWMYILTGFPTGLSILWSVVEISDFEVNYILDVFIILLCIDSSLKLLFYHLK